MLVFHKNIIASTNPCLHMFSFKIITLNVYVFGLDYNLNFQNVLERIPKSLSQTVCFQNHGKYKQIKKVKK